MTVILPQQPVQRSEEKEKYGEFYAVQEADVQTELDIEQKLLVTMMNLHMGGNQYDMETLERMAYMAIATLEYAKNLLAKYLPEDAPLMIAINDAVMDLKEFPDVESMIDIYQPLRDSILRAFAYLGFRRAKNPTYKWVSKAAEKMQMPMTPELEEKLGKKKGKLNKLCAMVAYSIESFTDKRDAIILQTGDRGNGKTRCGIRLGIGFHKETQRKFSLAKSIIYTDIGTLSYRLMTEFNLLVLIDEGYFVAKNIDVLKKKVKDLTDTLSAVRNRGHIIIINFIKFNRAAKTLLEIANYWIHKPSMDWGILYIRDREFVGDDPWAVEDLLKAKTLNRKRWLMKHNPNYICTMRIRSIKKRIFDRYEQYKNREQSAKANRDSSYQEEEVKTEFILSKLMTAYKEGLFDMNNAGYYLERMYSIPKRSTLGIIGKLRDRISKENLYKRMKEEAKVAVEPVA